jgi:hypothetical protein
MGNSILTSTLNLIPPFQPMALAQEKPTSPPAQPAPAPAYVAFAIAVGSWPKTDSRKPTVSCVALATITGAEHEKSMGRNGKLEVNIGSLCRSGYFFSDSSGLPNWESTTSPPLPWNVADTPGNPQFPHLSTKRHRFPHGEARETHASVCLTEMFRN